MAGVEFRACEWEREAEFGEDVMQMVEDLGGAGLGWGRGAQMEAEIRGRLCRGGGWWPWSGVAVHRPGVGLGAEDLLTTCVGWEVGAVERQQSRGTPVSGSWVSGRCIY